MNPDAIKIFKPNGEEVPLDAFSQEAAGDIWQTFDHIARECGLEPPNYRVRIGEIPGQSEKDFDLERDQRQTFYDEWEKQGGPIGLYFRLLPP